MKAEGRGVTLIEVLIATVILVFASLAIIQFYFSSLRFSELNKEEAIAQMHLTNIAEAVKCASFSELITDFPNGVSDGTAGNSYSALVGGYTLGQEQIVVSYVNSTSDPLEVTLSLNWEDQRGASLARYLVTKRTR
jgi:Tfp pilus assembly protein PilV